MNTKAICLYGAKGQLSTEPPNFTDRHLAQIV